MPQLFSSPSDYLQQMERNSCLSYDALSNEVLPSARYVCTCTPRITHSVRNASSVVTSIVAAALPSSRFSDHFGCVQANALSEADLDLIGKFGSLLLKRQPGKTISHSVSVRTTACSTYAGNEVNQVMHQDHVPP